MAYKEYTTSLRLCQPLFSHFRENLFAQGRVGWGEVGWGLVNSHSGTSKNRTKPTRTWTKPNKDETVHIAGFDCVLHGQKRKNFFAQPKNLPQIYMAKIGTQKSRFKI